MKNTPVRLHKQKTVSEKIDDFALKHADIIMPACLILGMVIFVWLCFNIVGVCAVESGGLRNFLAGGV